MPQPPRVKDLEDPNRCHWFYECGQCKWVQVPGSNYCERHARIDVQKERRRLYHLTDVRANTRLSQLIEHDPVAALGETIAVITRILTRRIDAIDSNSDEEFIRACAPVNTLLLTLERIKKAAVTLEKSLANLVPKESVLSLGQSILAVVIDRLSTIEGAEVIVPRITRRVVSAIASATNEPGVVPSHQAVVQYTGHKPDDSPDTKVLLLDDANEQLELARLSKHEKLKSLTEDIALALHMFERRASLVRSKNDLMNGLPTLNQQALTIAKLMTSAHNTEKMLGNLLNEHTVTTLGREVSAILVEELKDVPDYLQLVDELYEAIVADDTPRLPHQE